MNTPLARCICPKPKPTHAIEEQGELILGVLLWTGIEYEACERCGKALTEPVPLAVDE